MLIPNKIGINSVPFDNIVTAIKGACEPKLNPLYKNLERMSLFSFSTVSIVITIPYPLTKNHYINRNPINEIGILNPIIYHVSKRPVANIAPENP